jgi:hypothetical protein
MQCVEGRQEEQIYKIEDRDTVVEIRLRRTFFSDMAGEWLPSSIIVVLITHRSIANLEGYIDKSLGVENLNVRS